MMRPSPSPVRIQHLCLRCRVQLPRYASTATRVAVTASTLPQRVRPVRTTAVPIVPPSSRSLSSTSATSSPPSSSSSSSSAPRTHYDIFPDTLPAGPPPQGHFPIDTRALRREFLRLQARYHPDRHQHTPTDKSRAEAASSLINDAYRTLANPLLRAQYILSLRGVDVAEDETLKVEEPDLLMLVLEAREEIEDAEAEEDLSEPRRVNDERIAASEEALDQAFATDDIEKAKREAVRMRYWVNIKESLDNWEKGKPVVLEH